MSRSGPQEQFFLDTPRGILSRGGLVFHTTVSDLERLYGKVLEKVTLEDLIDRAELWLTSHRVITLWVLIPLLVFLPVSLACILGLGCFIGWKTVAPALGNAGLEAPLRVLSSVAAQLVGYVVAMSWLGVMGDHAALIAGLAAFAAIRWQLLDYALNPLTAFLHRKLYPLPVADQMLRALIHAAALKHKIKLSQFPRISRWMPEDEEDAN